MIEKLSKRMMTIASLANDDIPTYDLCCDHGLIGIAVMELKKSRELHLIDRVPQIIQTLEANILKYAQGKPIIARCLDANQIKVPSTRANIIIAGVGAKKITSILRSIYPGGIMPHKLILNPCASSKSLEKYLENLGWKITSHQVTERGVQHRILECEA